MTDHSTNTLAKYNYLINEVQAVYHEISLKLGITDSESIILYAVAGGEGDSCLIEEITRTGISKQTVNSSLRKLEERNIVYLENAGGRKKRICLTENGKLFAESTVKKIIVMENDIFSEWTQEERETYLALSQKYLVMLKSRAETL